MATIKPDPYQVCDICKERFDVKEKYFIDSGGSIKTHNIDGYRILKRIFEIKIKYVGQWRFGEDYTELCKNCADTITETINNLRKKQQ